MRRRGFLGAAVVGGVGTALPRVADAQGRRGGTVRRPGWTEHGPPGGREPGDPTALSALERRHAPVISAPTTVARGRPFDLAIRVGVDMHPMSEDHHIGWIEVYVGDERAWVLDLTPQIPYPVVRVPLRLDRSTPLTVRAWCNQHGPWRTRLTLPIR